MTPQLRWYQHELKARVYDSWARGNRVVCMQSHTGSGKTVTFCDIIRERAVPSAVLVHRNELVGQISLSLAANGLTHALIASHEQVRSTIEEHMAEFGRSYIDPNAPTAAISVQTMVRRREKLRPWSQHVRLWVADEGHHVLADNMWGKCATEFTHPHALGLLPTATPRRSDGKGLGRHADGLADDLVLGPPADLLMREGFLTPYRVYCVEHHIERYLSGVVGPSGDWTSGQAAEAVEAAGIVGDIAANYLKYAAGNLGLTFAPDLVTAGRICEQYRQAGVPSEVIHGDMDWRDRRELLRRFKAREVLQLVAIDVVSEGFDVPHIEVVTFCRPTKSLGLYRQQFGRVLRPAPGKEYAIVIDHVGNYLEHQGGPETPILWSLDRRQSRASSNVEADGLDRYRICPNCTRPMAQFLRSCPHCGYMPERRPRSSIEESEGDLYELTPQAMAALRASAGKAAMSSDDYRSWLIMSGCPMAGVGSNVRRHQEAQQAREMLVIAMGGWGGQQKARGLSDAEMQRKFYQSFGVDVLSAQTLNTQQTLDLTMRVTRVFDLYST